MRALVKLLGRDLKTLFETVWDYLGSLAAVCLFAAVLGLGIYHAVVQDVAPRYYCFAGVHNPAGAEPPRGIVSLGADSSPGVRHVRLEYDANGRLQRMKSVDADGKLCALPGSRVAEQRLFYDAAGHLRKRENRDAGGALAEDAQGVAVREFEHNAAGRLTRTLFRNAAGKPAAPVFPGFAECLVSYDASGRPVQVLFLGADGKPLRNADGEERVEYKYGADGSVMRCNFVGEEPADNAAGYAVEETRYAGGCTTRRRLDARGHPVVQSPADAACLHHESAPQHGAQHRSLMPKDGELKSYCRACSGRIDACSQQRNPVHEFYHNAGESPAPVCELRHADTETGPYVLSLQRDGSTTVNPL